MQLNSVLKKKIFSVAHLKSSLPYMKKQGVNGNENCFLSLKLTLAMFTEVDIPCLKNYFSLLLSVLGFIRELKGTTKFHF